MLEYENELIFIEYVKSDQIEKALSYLDTYPELISNPSQDTAAYISKVLLLCNAYEECIEFSTFHMTNKPSVELFSNLAFAYEKTKNTLEAIKYYQCSRLFTTNFKTRAEAELKIQQLRYPDLDEETFDSLMLYFSQQKKYVLAQLRNPGKQIEPEDYIKTTIPIQNEKPKIFYGTMEIANHISHYLNYFRSHGFDVFGINYEPTYLNYNCDFSFNLSALSPEQFQEHFLLNAADLIVDYDIFHFIFNKTLMPDSTDLVPLNRLHKKIFMHNLGSEVRIPEIARTHHDYWKYAENYLSQLSSEINNNNLRVYSNWIPNCIVNDYEMNSYVSNYYKNVYMLGLPIDLRSYSYYGVSKSKKIHIVHAPTNPTVKGTVYFEEAIQKLSEKYPIQYTRIERMDHHQAMEIYKTADIICDQLIIGTYGSLAIEAMAMGKCVASFVNPNFQTPHGTDIPIWNLNIDNIYERLEELIVSPELRASLSIKSRIYVERNNDINIVGKQLLDIYML